MKSSIKAGLSRTAFLLAFIAFGSLHLSAQVHYVDIIPDTAIRVYERPVSPWDCCDHHYQLDVNLDDTVDFFIHAKCGYHNDNTDSLIISIESAGPSDFFAAGDFVDSLNFNDTIDASLQWVSGEKVIYYRNNCWKWDKEYFAGLRMMDGSSSYFGWLRMILTYPDFEFSVVLKDLAFQTVPEEAILAGEGLQNFALNIQVADVGDQKNGADMEVSFDPAYDEMGIVEYRIMVVKPEQAATFTVDSASTVASGRYTSVAANDSSHSLQLAATATTTDGQPITNMIDYSVFILSSYEDPSINILSYPVAILFQTQTVAVDSILSIDNGHAGNGSDVLISFNKVANENMISEYWIMIVPGDQLSAFDLEMANQVEPGNFTAIAPSGSNISVTMDEQSTDILGEAITKEKGYYAYVLSVADGLLTDKNALSGPSNLFVLSSPDYLYAGQKDEPYIHYVDIEPDTVVWAEDYGEGNPEFDFDLNGDGTNDYLFRSSASGGIGFHNYGSSITGSNENNKISTTEEHSNWVKIFNYGDPITFRDKDTSGHCVFSHYHYDDWSSGSTGYWGGVKNKFTSLIMVQGNDTIMGWVKMSVGGSSTMIIKEYAWMYYPPQNEGLPDESSCELSVYPMPVNDQFYIQTCLPCQKCDIYIYDLAGHVVTSFRLALVSNEPATVDPGTLRQGIYVLKVMFKEQTISRKITVMR